jgi:hypothetical protein
MIPEHPIEADMPAIVAECSMSNRDRILREIRERPGQTACQVTARLFRLEVNRYNRYKSASVLKALHRLAEKHYLKQRKQPGQRPSVKAWHFYPK